jgi:hypothetical protein
VTLKRHQAVSRGRGEGTAPKRRPFFRTRESGTRWAWTLRESSGSRKSDSGATAAGSGWAASAAPAACSAQSGTNRSGSTVAELATASGVHAKECGARLASRK